MEQIRKKKHRIYVTLHVVLCCVGVKGENEKSESKFDTKQYGKRKRNLFNVLPLLLSISITRIFSCSFSLCRSFGKNRKKFFCTTWIFTVLLFQIDFIVVSMFCNIKWVMAMCAGNDSTTKSTQITTTISVIISIRKRLGTTYKVSPTFLD